MLCERAFDRTKVMEEEHSLNRHRTPPLQRRYQHRGYRTVVTT